MYTSKPRGRIRRIFWLLAAVAMIMAVMPLAGAAATETTYPDQMLSAGGVVDSEIVLLDSGHFDDVYDLTAGDMTLSFTYDGWGLIDVEWGVHAWAELGVRSEATVLNPPIPEFDPLAPAQPAHDIDFNPYWRTSGWEYDETVTLLAGRNIDAGDVIVTSDATHLYVTYRLDDGWCMTKSHFAVATEWENLPQTKNGNAKPGQFPYGDDYDSCATGDVVLDPIPFTDIHEWDAGDPLSFAAYAELLGAVDGTKRRPVPGRSEAAWADGPGFPGKNWSMYFNVTPTPPVLAEGSGVWLKTDYPMHPHTLLPDFSDPVLDDDDKLMLQRVGGDTEQAYDLPSVLTSYTAYHGIWFDRDGVSVSEATHWGNVDGATYNTGGAYDVVITLHATSATTGTAYMTVDGNEVYSGDQGFYGNGPSTTNPPDLYPAGMTFTGDMEHLVVFYGLFGYSATHQVTFSDITVTQ